MTADNVVDDVALFVLLLFSFCDVIFFEKSSSEVIVRLTFIPVLYTCTDVFRFSALQQPIS